MLAYVIFSRKFNNKFAKGFRTANSLQTKIKSNDLHEYYARRADKNNTMENNKLLSL